MKVSLILKIFTNSKCSQGLFLVLTGPIMMSWEGEQEELARAPEGLYWLIPQIKNKHIHSPDPHTGDGDKPVPFSVPVSSGTLLPSLPQSRTLSWSCCKVWLLNHILSPPWIASSMFCDIIEPPIISSTQYSQGIFLALYPSTGRWEMIVCKM